MTSLENYRQIKAILCELEKTLPPFQVSPEQLSRWQSCLQAGNPALGPDDFPVRQASSAFLSVLQAMHGLSLTAEQAQAMITAYWDDLEDNMASSLTLDPAVLSMYLHLSCQWALQQLAVTVAAHVSYAAWDACHCPACGGVPSISYFADDGARRLVCDACHTAWRYKRIACAFCGNQNHETLRTLAANEYPGWSVMVCQACHGTIKTADLRLLTAIPDWTEAQLTLLPLDFAAESWLSNLEAHATTAGKN